MQTTIECVDAAAAARLAAMLTEGGQEAVTAYGTLVDLPRATARAVIRAALLACRDGLMAWEAAADLIEGFDLDGPPAPALVEVAALAEHLAGCPLAPSQCERCSGVGARFGRVAAVRQLLDTRGHGNFTATDLAELMTGVTVMLCAADRCSANPTAPAIRTVHHPNMGSLPLCEADAARQERRNLR